MPLLRLRQAGGGDPTHRRGEDLRRLERDVEGREPERYELREGPAYRFDVSRRTFMGLVGAGVLLATQGPSRGQGGAGAARPATGTIAARLHLGEDGRITVFTSKVEVGQGSRTQITMAAAEELRVAAGRIELVMADTDLVPADGGTFGSLTTPRTVPAVRKAAAAARNLLLELAAKKLGTDATGLRIDDGVIAPENGGQTISYADLAKQPALAERLAEAVPDEVTVTAVAEWQTLGAAHPTARGRDIVTGTHRYPSDIRRPGMVYGKVLRAPAYGATLMSVELGAADGMADVVAVRDGDFVGCAAPTSFLAQQALGAIGRTAEWSAAEHPSSSELFDVLRQSAHHDGTGRQRPRSRERGDVEAAMAGAKTRTAAEYEIAYIQHAPMEPRAAVADWQGDRLTVWLGTQRPHGVRAEVARAFTMPNERVRVIVPDTGGGFGGKHTGEVAIEAARLAKAAGRPVSLRWTRQEEFDWAYFRPAGVIRFEAGLDSQSSIVAWTHTNLNSGASAMVAPYSFKDDRSQFVYCDSPLREGSYRGIAATANNFARECFIDELAIAAERDPLDYRLAHLEDARLRDVLEASAKQIGWRDRERRRRPNFGFGIAGGTEKGSYVATAAEVEIDRQRSAVGIVRLCVAYECGAIQNPDNLLAQVEGGVIMGLGGALWEAIEFEDGRLRNGSFARYPVPRFKDVPPIETQLLDRRDLPSVGAGETPIIAVAPAIGNAIYDAVGVRIRAMPLRSDELRG